MHNQKFILPTNFLLFAKEVGQIFPVTFETMEKEKSKMALKQLCNHT